MKEVSAFLDDQGHSRVLINGRVQPVRYSHLASCNNTEQSVDFGRLGVLIDMTLEANRKARPHLLLSTQTEGN